MTHLLSRAFEDSLGIRQFTATDEAKIDVVFNYPDVANTVLHPVCRAVMERDDIHFEDVLAAGRHLFEDQLSQREREFLNSPVVRFE